MVKNQPVTTDILQKALDKQSDSLRKELKQEISGALDKQERRIKGFIKKQDKKYKRYIDSINGHFESQNALMAESILDVREKIVILTEKVDRNTEDIEIIKLNVNLIRNDLRTKIEHEEFAALENRVSILEQKEKKRANC